MPNPSGITQLTLKVTIKSVIASGFYSVLVTVISLIGFSFNTGVIIPAKTVP